MKTSVETTELIKLLLRVDDYFMARAEFPTSESESTCLVWLGPMSRTANRATHFPLMKVRKEWKPVKRYVWNALYSPLPSTTRLRNLCDNERCVNPEHHSRTDRFCKFGHALVGANVFIQQAIDKATQKPYTYERCRECGRQRNTIYRGATETYKPQPHRRKTA